MSKKLTNKHGLPRPIADALSRDTYEAAGDISVTELISPPQMAVLEWMHADEIESDVIDRVFSMLGTSVHAMIDNAVESNGNDSALPWKKQKSNYRHEERLVYDLDGTKVSGKFDLWDVEWKELWDFKVTSLWNATRPTHDEWTAQLNCYAWLIRMCTGERIQKAKILAIMRNWSSMSAKFKKDDGYPEHPIRVIPIKIWSDAEQDEYVRERVRLHGDAWAIYGIHRQMNDANHLPPCTDAERWFSGHRHALIKYGAKRATKVFDTAEEAEVHAAEKGLEIGHGKGLYQLESRPGDFKRCDEYCTVSRWCRQHNLGLDLIPPSEK